MVPLLNPRDIEFLLYEMLDTEALLSRPRYQDHSREDFDAILTTARQLAETHFADHNAKGDANEPTFDGDTVTMIPEVKTAWDLFAKTGFLAAAPDYEEGGLQLPEIILRAAMAYFNAANVSTTAYPFLSIGAANLIRTFGSPEQKALYLPAMMAGRYSGTMALTEPGQGSSLADIKTYAVPERNGDTHPEKNADNNADNNNQYRLFGNKMYISAGDHNLTDNIVHMVLARIKGAPAGVKGISLFIVPKVLVNQDGSLGERNDVALGGLLHKMGYRGTTSTVLNFGEQQGAVAYLLGEPHKGLQYMFQMMNEARIAVGFGAACLAYRGYQFALDYARQRPQGRLPSSKDPASSQVNIIQHADVRRMLLAQKAYAEGSVALCLYGCALQEDSQTADNEKQRQRAHALLDLLTPIIKSYPSKYGCVANELAIQVHGGGGYTREYPVEQLYRDQRLNPIHEGTEAIHGIDLLGRKVGQAGFQFFFEVVNTDIEFANKFLKCQRFAQQLADSLTQLRQVSESVQLQMADNLDKGLANATLYLDFFGRITVAWLWLKQAALAGQALDNSDLHLSDEQFYQGKLQAARYFFDWELPQTGYQAELLKAGNCTPFDMQDAWF